MVLREPNGCLIIRLPNDVQEAELERIAVALNESMADCNDETRNYYLSKLLQPMLPKEEDFRRTIKDYPRLY